MSDDFIDSLYDATARAEAPGAIERFFEWTTFSAFWIAFWLLPLIAILYLIYFCVSLPLRRRERARFFIDLIETGLKQGGIEESITAMARTRDLDPGARFHLAAAHIESGMKLSEAVARSPGLVPPQINAMLRVGEEIGDIRRILPACRSLLADAGSRTRSAFDYLVVMMLVLLPVLPAVFLMFQTFALPRFLEIFHGMGMELPGATVLLTKAGSWIALAQLALALALYGAAIFYVGGPRFSGWLQAGFFPFLDIMAFLFPWRRKRMQRDFAMMLALLLDAGIAEARAVKLAAEGTANRIFIRRAERVVDDLRSGVKLPEALRGLDESGEFRWRIENAARTPAGFMAALSGWLESLDAKAFQQEQTASQTFTTSLVLINGLMVGVMVIGVFQLLVTLTEEAVLW